VRDPGAALALWSRIDREITDAAPQIGIIVPIRIDIVSLRLGHEVQNPIWGPMYDQAWVR
jgi:hypothetical protein